MEMELRWLGDLRFDARSGQTGLVLDAKNEEGPSPVHALAAALAGCMAIDLVHILTKARVPPQALLARLVADRAVIDPKRFTRIDLRFIIEGDVPPDTIERAIGLSRDKYCSVWHSLRPDIEFVTSFELRN
jgi:putative redox protein